jgi:hypothetical protein
MLALRRAGGELGGEEVAGGGGAGMISARFTYHLGEVDL